MHADCPFDKYFVNEEVGKLHSGLSDTHTENFYPRMKANIQSVLKASRSVQKRVKVKGT